MKDFSSQIIWQQLLHLELLLPPLETKKGKFNQKETKHANGDNVKQILASHQARNNFYQEEKEVG